MPLCVLGALSPPTLCDPMDCSSPGCSVPGILQARILEWVAISFPRGSSQPRDGTRASHIAGRLFTIWATREALIRELQINTVRYHYTAVRMSKIQTLASLCWWGCGATWVFVHCLWEYKMVQSLWKILQQFHTELNLLLPQNPAVTFLGIYQMSWKLVHTKACNKDVYRSLVHVGEWKNKHGTSRQRNNIYCEK